MEIIIWGKPKGEKCEQLLISEQAGIRTVQKAKEVIKMLESKYGCTKCRYSVLDWSKPDFVSAISI